MLARARAATALAALFLAAACGGLLAGRAAADVGPCGFYICVGAGSPGAPPSSSPTAPGSSGGAGGAATACTFNGQSYPCYEQGVGYFNTGDGCYWEQMTPQPPAGDIGWGGHQPGDGAVYLRTCPDNVGNAQTEVWLKNPPPGYGGGMTAAQLAQVALSKMLLAGPRIGIAPRQGGVSLVGLPVWLWTQVTPSTWGPTQASASAGALTVTATARVTQIAWDMGDGTVVVCASPGEAYQASYGAAAPPCGHTYTATSASQPGGHYTITATSTWTVTWTATSGQQGQLTATRQSQTTAVIGEAQALNTN